MSKGSNRRPGDDAKFREGWDRIFGLGEDRVKPRTMVHPDGTVHDECPDCRGVCKPAEEKVT